MTSIRSLTFTYTFAYLVLLALLAISIRWFDSYPKEQERALEYQQKDIRSIQNSIRFSHKDLTFSARDYASFRAIRNLIQNPNPELLELAQFEFNTSLINIEYIALINGQDDISASFYKSEGKQKAFIFSEQKKEVLKQRYLTSPTSAIIEDFELFNDNPVMVSVHPVKDLTKREKPIIGRIILASRLSGDAIVKMEKIVQIPIFESDERPTKLRNQIPLEANLDNDITSTSTRCLFDNKNTLISCFIISHDKSLIPKFLDWESFAPFLAFALIPMIIFWLTLSKFIIPLEKLTHFLRRRVINEDIKKIPVPSPVIEVEQVRSTFNELCDIVNQQKHALEKLTEIDQLTGIANRRAFDNELERSWNQLSRNGGRCALILCDLDFFKLFNDHYGHLHGDKILKLVASTLENFARRSDEICARFGGEEFILIMHYQEQQQLEKRLDGIIKAINQLQEPHKESSFGHLTLSLGISTLEVGANELIQQQSKDWIKQADDALYQAKELGRNQYILHPFVFTALD
ncbi:hypothetical protein A9R00_05410 [Oleispira antarctica]|uniref:diguanylate cyclase n=1 Tax=Oleispira antarctica TaxID=188908 RepID=A0A1Y5HTB6_OLEAN|nr:hypothetical protein A9R00_05410 [Oleispira antarctica]